MATAASMRKAAPCMASVLEQQLDKRGGAVPAPSAARLEVRVELVDERGDREARTGFPRFPKADAEILSHPLDGEAEAFGLELAHLLPAILHLPGLRGPFRDHRYDLLQIQVRSFCKSQGFGQRLGQAGDADLVDHLGELAR